jgi:hypothetical protein
MGAPASGAGVWTLAVQKNSATVNDPTAATAFVADTITDRTISLDLQLAPLDTITMLGGSSGMSVGAFAVAAWLSVTFVSPV